MIDKYRMRGFFSTNVPQLKCSIDTFAALVQKIIPDLSSFLVCFL